MKKQLLAVLLMVFACFVLAGCSDDTFTPTGTVSGKLVDSNGAPISGITVLLLNNGFQPYTSASAAAKFGSYSSMNAANRVACVSAATTDTNGAYSIAGVPYGTYSVLPVKSNSVEQFISTAEEGPNVVTVGPEVAVANFKQRMAGGLLTMSSPGSARDPIFFIHISDTHFAVTPDKEETSGSERLMSSLFTDVVPVIKPLATIHTGDVVDKGHDEDAWLPYTKLFNDSILAPYTKYVAIIGNHDVKVPGPDDVTFPDQCCGSYETGLQNFLLYAQTPTRYGYTTLESPAGTVRLIRTNTAASTETNYIKRNWENIYGYFPENQQQNLYNHPDRNQTVVLNVVLGHSPVATKYIYPPVGYTPGTPIYKPNTNPKTYDDTYMYQITDGNGRMKQLISEFQAPLYLSGHVHKPGMNWLDNKSLVVRTDNFLGSKARFYLVAYDFDAKSPSVKLVSMIDVSDAPPAPKKWSVKWPIVFITTPANSSLGNTTTNDPNEEPYTAGNPNAVPFTTDQTIMLKTMVFSPETVTSVEYVVDNGPTPSPLATVRNTNGRVWATGIPLAGLSKGSHTVTVTARRSNGTTGTDKISIVVQ